MTPSRRSRLIASVLALASPAAWACADLPNICEMQAQHHQQQVEMARQASEAQQQQAMDAFSAPSAPAGPPADPMGARLTAAQDVFEAARLGFERQAELQRDPRYQAYMQGAWEFFQDDAPPRPGEYCSALFWKGNTLVRLSGPGGDYRGALLTFWSPDIPRPEGVRKTPVTLAQSGDDPPQTVEAFHYGQTGHPYAAIVFAVPSLDALLDNILDRHAFEVRLDGQVVAQVEWHDGFAARDALRACTAQRTAP